MRRHQKGFSLIEMLAVVFVVVLLTSLVSLNVGSGSADINRENQVRDVAAMLGYTLTEAELSGTDHGLLIHRLDSFDDGSYGGLWLRRYDQGWAEPLSLNTAFVDLVFEPGVELELRLEERASGRLLSAGRGCQSTATDHFVCRWGGHSRRT